MLTATNSQNTSIQRTVEFVATTPSSLERGRRRSQNRRRSSPGSTEDFSNENTAPPGLTSPFGTDGTCGTAPPPIGP